MKGGVFVIRVANRILALLMLFLILCSTCLPVAKAADLGSTANEEMTIKSQYIHQAFCNLKILDGTAKIQGFVKGTNGATTKCEIELKLQLKVLIWWVTVGTWNKTALSYQASLNATHSVESGKTYRAVAVCTVWNGSNSESATVTSASVEAP